MRFWQFISWLDKLLERFMPDKVLENIVPPPAYDKPPQELDMNLPPKKPAAQIIVEAALASNGLDLTPDDKIPDARACVVQLLAVLQKTPYALLDNTAYTPRLKEDLDASPLWKRVLEPTAGCIIVSPTEGVNIGHTGLFITKDLIMSNNSFGGFAGRFTQNYTYETWVDYFKRTKGLHIYLWEPVEP